MLARLLSDCYTRIHVSLSTYIMFNVIICLYCMIRSKMGFLESGSIYLHKMCWHPQEPGSTHIQSQVSQPGPMDLRTNPGSVYTRVHCGSSSKEQLRHLGVRSGSVQTHRNTFSIMGKFIVFQLPHCF